MLTVLWYIACCAKLRNAPRCLARRYGGARGAHAPPSVPPPPLPSPGAKKVRLIIRWDRKIFEMIQK